MTYLDDSYRSMVHNHTLSQLYMDNCTTLGLEFCQDPAVLGRLIFSTDMGDVSYRVPSLHPIYSIGTTAPNHSVDFAKACGKLYFVFLVITKTFTHLRYVLIIVQCRDISLTQFRS